ncbi:MAG: hypothetical protein IJD72_00725 [Alistipes sp.]|nr:hypothetical protein [Alistipes sp.]
MSGIYRLFTALQRISLVPKQLLRRIACITCITVSGVIQMIRMIRDTTPPSAMERSDQSPLPEAGD